MTLKEVNTQITNYTKANTSQFINANRIILINKAVKDITMMILQAQDGWDFDDANHDDFPILTTNLVANQQDYALPTNTIKVVRLEITYDGTNWHKVSPMDINQESSPTDTTTINNDFEKSEPYYDLRGGSIFLYPIPDTNITGGLKIWIDRNADNFTESDLSTGTKSLGFVANFHDMVAIKVALDYAIQNGKSNYNLLKQEYLEYEQRLKQYYSDRDVDTKMSLGAAYQDYK